MWPFTWNLLKSEAKADEEAVGLQRCIVALVEVEQTETVATKQVKVGELDIGAEHSVEVETALVDVVAIPIGAVFAKDGINTFGNTGESETRHRTHKRNDGQVTIDIHLVVE